MSTLTAGIRLGLVPLIFLLVMTCDVAAGEWDDSLARIDSLIARMDFDQATAYGQDALREAEKAFGPNDTVVARFLDRLGICFRSQSYMYQADSAWSRAFDIQEPAFGFDHLETVSTCLRLAQVRKFLYDFDGAWDLFYRISTQIRPTSDSLSSMIATSWTSLSQISWEQGRYDSAEEYCRKSLEIYKRLYGDDASETIGALVMLANIYSAQSRLLEAEELYKKALSIAQEPGNTNERRLIICLYYYGNFLQEMGKVEKAIDMFTRTTDLVRRNYGDEHPYLLSCLVYLGTLYSVQLDSQKSVANFQTALRICREKLGDDNPYYPMILSNLATNMLRQGEFEKADSLSAESIRLWDKQYGPGNHLSADAIGQLAEIRELLGRYESAAELSRQSLGYVAGRYTHDGADVFEGLDSLLSLCRTLDSLSDTDPGFYHAALEIQPKIMKYNVTEVVQQLRLITQLCFRSGFTSEAWEFGLIAYRLQVRNLLTVAPLQSDLELGAFFRSLDDIIGNCLGVYFHGPEKTRESTRAMANLIVTQKGVVADLIVDRWREQDSESNILVSARLDSLAYLKRRLAAVFSDQDGDRSTEVDVEVDSILELITSLEISVNSSDPELSSRELFTDVSIDAITSKLPDRTSLVEFLSCADMMDAGNNYPGLYIAVVLNKGHDPEIVRLGLAYDVNEAVDTYLAHMNRIAGQGGIVSEEDAAEYREIAGRIYELIWQPLEAYITDPKMVLVASDNTLNAVSFASLPDENGIYLAEKATIHYLPSGRSLTRPVNSNDKGTGLFAMGAPDFNANITAATLRSVSYAGNGEHDADNDSTSFWECRDLSDICLQPLPGAREELEEVVSQWRGTTDEKAIVYMGPEATEERFKREAPGKRIIHIATHGYFLNCGEYYSRIGNPEKYVPSLLSGLFLEEVNHLGKSEALKSADDGILTAYEVSTMNLKGVDLVILSACESALGGYYDNHETYGLTWAFRKAGVRSVVSSLWPVSDKISSEMLGALYHRQDICLADRLRDVQVDYIKKARAEHKPDHPVNWGAFISVGDWR